jgi:hypothetical protein
MNYAPDTYSESRARVALRNAIFRAVLDDGVRARELAH